MSTSDILNEARKTIHETIKNIRYKKAIKDRDKRVAVEVALQKCRGALERSKNDFDRIIRTQCKKIGAGQTDGYNTDVQEQLLKDASLGYIICKDAIYVMESFANVDSMNCAYSMLNYAVENMTGKKRHSIKAKLTEAKVERSSLSYMASEQAYARREDTALSIFPELKKTGNIEQCLKLNRIPEDIEQNIEINRIGSGLPASLSASDNASSDEDQTAVQDAVAFLEAQSGKGDFTDINSEFLRTIANSKPPTSKSDT